jgi:hypothetical protein
MRMPRVRFTVWRLQFNIKTLMGVIACAAIVCLGYRWFGWAFIFQAGVGLTIVRLLDWMGWPKTLATQTENDPEQK